jgi:Ca2+-binding RTX toxin-like protein
MVALGVVGPAGGTLNGVTQVPAQNGVATFTNLSLSTADSYTLFAASDSDLTGSTAPITAVAVDPVTHFSVVAASSSVTAGQSLSVTVTALDSQDRTDTGYLGTVHFTTSDPQLAHLDDYAFTASDNGTHTFSVILKTAGPETVTVADLTNSTAQGTSRAIAVVAASLAGLDVHGFPLLDVIGTAHPFIVTAVDTYGNRVKSYRGQVGFAIAGGTAKLPPSYTFTAADAGRHTFAATLTAPGRGQVLSATDTANDIAGKQTGIAVVAPATHLAVTLTPATTAVAGQTFTITVTALDPANRPDARFTDPLHFMCSDPQAVPPADQAFAGSGGRESFTITLKTAGTQTIRVTDIDHGAIKGMSRGLVIAAGSLSALSVFGFPSPTFPSAAHTFTVMAVDAYGNRVSSYRGQVQFGVTGGTANLPSDTTFTAADHGRRNFTADLDTVGTSSLTAMDSANNSIHGEQANIDVANLTAGISGPSIAVPGQPLSFTLSAVEDGVSANAVFTYAIDWDGNGTIDQVVQGVNGRTITHAYSSNGTVTPAVMVTDRAGNVSAAGQAPQPINIQSVAMETDPADSAKTALAIGGTPAADVITITPADASGQQLAVSIDGADQGGPFAPTGHILVYGDGGNDVIEELAGTNGGAAVSVAVPALIFAGTGNCTLSAAGSSANNILVGGSGSNHLTGGSGRDILIGGGGGVLQAGSGGDLLIAGSTAYDVNVQALLALLAEWGRTDIDYLQRVQDLFSGGSGAANGNVLLNEPAVTAGSASSQLIGGSDGDWFWFAKRPTAPDQINAFAAGEAATLR